MGATDEYRSELGLSETAPIPDATVFDPFAEPELSISNGLLTGTKVVANAIGDGLHSLYTVGGLLPLGRLLPEIPVTQDDYGYDSAYIPARVGTELLLGLGIGKAAQGTGYIAQGALGLDAVGNLSAVGQGGYDVYQSGGFTYGNTAQILGGVAGITGNVGGYFDGATGRAANSAVTGNTPTGRAFDPAKAQPGTTVTNIDPNSLTAGRSNLISGRLANQEQLISSGTPRHTRIKVTQSGVIYDGNHGTRAAINKGTSVDVDVINESARGFGPVGDLPITER